MKLKRTIAIIAVAGTSLLSATAQSAPAKDQAPSGTAQPASKGQVQAKTQAEYDAYQAIKSKAQTPDEFEKAVDDFAAKFPDSNLRVVLYRGVMKSFQQADNADKMMAAGLKVLTIDKDDPEALIVVAEIQEEHTSAMDLDREERMDQAVANAQHALQTIDTDLSAPAGTPPDRLEAYKKYLRSTALAIVGTIQYKRAQYADAEGMLRKAIDADAANPDAVVVLRLALALDQQKKYQDALQQANRAVDLTKEDTDAGRSARSERDRLVVETGGNNTPASNPPVNDAPASNPPLKPPASVVPPPSATAPVNAPPTAPPQSSASPSH
jgi:tetratricopeptide (TPR) repeat protein